MNGLQCRKAQNEKQIPGCLGRMVNLFDLGNDVNVNRLLTDKPHNDGSSLSRSCSDVASTRSAHFGDQIGDKMTISELRRSSSNKRANGTPMKTLIAQEMSKEIDSRQSPPNVVAKLMGLDTLPHQQHSSPTERSHSKAYSTRSLSQSKILSNCWEQDHRILEKRMQSEEQNDYRDVYEIWQQSGKANTRDINANERKMALVRQKFIEAKRLATDEKSRQSKEFQDALEVLSSNRDLFLKFLQEPHSLLSQNLYDIQSIPSPPETKRITVLRPSKATDDEKFSESWKTGDKQSKKPTTFSNQRFEEYPAQPTRIVVLKPSPGMAAQESIEAAKEITEEMHSMGHRRDETLLSSVFSNGYIGDDSSFNKSENEYAVGNLSDSEAMSPTSRHSWDYINRSSSPFSSSSFSRASCSPESSVCREAKKRLSERWALMASNGNFSEVKNSRRSSSTLGEMLALSDTKNVKLEEEATIKEVEPSGSTSDSPKSLHRSRSLPVSSMVCGLNAEVSESEVGKTEISKELKKAKSAKSWKVSTLFFSRNKKPNKEKSGASHSKDESQSVIPEAPGATTSFPGKIGDDASQCANSSDLEDCFSPVLSGPSCNTVPTSIKEGVMSVPKPVMAGNISENQDQPSPISVLEPPFEEDDSTVPVLSAKYEPNLIGAEVPPKSNLIDKSPPIESIARTLSWDDSCVETAASYSSKPSLTSSNTEDEQYWPLLIQTLLSSAGLDSNTKLDTFSTRWHSLESPLDPTLRAQYANQTNKEVLHEAKRRQRRSNRKLMFDCVNEAIIEHGPDSMMTSAMLVDRVWGQLKEWLVSEVGPSFEDGGDWSSLAVERLVRKEMVGKGWSDNMKVEMDSLGIEIEDKLLAELVEDTVVHFTSCV